MMSTTKIDRRDGGGDGGGSVRGDGGGDGVGRGRGGGGVGNVREEERDVREGQREFQGLHLTPFHAMKRFDVPPFLQTIAQS